MKNELMATYHRLGFRQLAGEGKSGKYAEMVHKGLTAGVQGGGKISKRYEEMMKRAWCWYARGEFNID